MKQGDPAEARSPFLTNLTTTTITPKQYTLRLDTRKSLRACNAPRYSGPGFYRSAAWPRWNAIWQRHSSTSAHGPLLYLSCQGRLDEAIAAVAPHGGKVLQARHPIGPYGFRAVVLDSEVNRIALHSM